jgi:hypothetical protein
LIQRSADDMLCDGVCRPTEHQSASKEEDRPPPHSTRGGKAASLAFAVVLYSWVSVEETGLKELALELAELAVEDSLGLVIEDPPGLVVPSFLVSPSSFVALAPVVVVASVSMSSSAFSTLLA